LFYLWLLNKYKFLLTVLHYLLLSVVLSGLLISFFTLLSERLGTRLGGMVSNLPSTLLVSLLFIALTKGAEFASAATDTVPLGMILSTLFLFTFLLLLPKGLWIAVAGSLLAYVTLAIGVSHFESITRLGWTIVYGLVAITCWILAEKKLKIISAKPIERRYNLSQIIIRAAFAGSVVGSSVLIAQYGSPFWTGIFSTFPAVMLSSMVILTITAGAAFARGLGKIMLLASTNIVVYGYLVGILYPTIGIVAGTLLAFMVAAGWVILLKPILDMGK